MKRIFRYILSVATVALMAVGCQEEPVVTVNPQDIIAPVLHSNGLPSEIEVTPTNQSEEVTFTWSAADMGFGAQLNYTVEMFIKSVDEDGVETESIKTAVSGGVAATTAVVNYEDINYALIYSLGAVPLESLDVFFRIKAAMGTYCCYSDAVTINVIPTNAEKQFKNVYFVGSYCDWQHAQAQLLYDYDENGLKYQAVVDFGAEFMESTFQGFKLTAKGNWVEGEWGDGMAYDKTIDYQSLPKDPAEVPLLTGGSGGNCERYTSSHRYYHFTMSAEALMLYMDAAFDEANLVIGDQTLPLTFIAKAHKQKFYTDVTVKEGDKFKVVLSGKDVDDVVFGADETATEGLLVLPEEGAEAKEVEVSVEPGDYRLYINMNDWNAVTYEFKAENYGTEEGAGPVVETYKGWGINGTFNDWMGDIPMEYDGTSWYVAKNVSLKRDQDFKFRKDGKDMVVFQGGGFAIDTETWQSHSGSHIIVHEDCTVDVYLNITNGCCWFCTPGSRPSSGASVQRPEGMSDWSICGTFNNWSEDAPDYWMEQKGDWFVARNAEFAAKDEFKIRELYRWDISIKTFDDSTVVADTPYPLENGTGEAKNVIVREAGTYDVWMSYKNNSICLMTPGSEKPLIFENKEEEKPKDAPNWTISGSFNNWGDNWLTVDGDYYVIKDLELEAGDEFKFRYMKDWNWANIGLGASVEPDCCYAAVRGGGNFTVTTTGKYDIYVYSGDMSRVYVMTAGNPIENATEVVVRDGWAVSGQFNDWGTAWMDETDNWFVAEGIALTAGGEFKLRFGADWRDNRVVAGGTISVGTAYEVKNGDGNMKMVTSGTFDVYLSKDLTTMYVMNQGEVPVLVEKTTVTVYADVDRSTLYAWWDADGVWITNAWPGSPYLETKKIGNVTYKVWYLTVPAEKVGSAKIRVQFNNGGDDGKTSDSDALTLTEEMYLTISGGKPALRDMTQPDPEEPETPENPEVTPPEGGRTVTVYSSSQNMPNLYVWDVSENKLNGDWPGTEGIDVSNDGIVYKGKTYAYKWVLNNVTVDNIYMILNANSVQTQNSEVIPVSDEIYISHREADGNHYVVWDNWPEMQVTVLCETSYEYLYGWWSESGDYVTATWPGTKSSGTVQKDGKTYRKWELTVRKDRVDAGKSVKYILNNGSGEQTEDSDEVTLSAEAVIEQPAKKVS